MISRNASAILQLLLSARELSKDDDMTNGAIDLTGKLLAAGWESEVFAVLIAIDKVHSEIVKKQLDAIGSEDLIEDVVSLLLDPKSDKNKARVKKLSAIVKPPGLGEQGVLLEKVIEELTELHLGHLKECSDCRNRMAEERAKKKEGAKPN